mmetsp:Transcript_18813/g.40350  ORF Transcript_18813/g.40350 Transcript_18813/m.40350 type:complete len:256 (-) Transcript_18813:1114-1881(-)
MTNLKCFSSLDPRNNPLCMSCFSPGSPSFLFPTLEVIATVAVMLSSSSGPPPSPSDILASTCNVNSTTASLASESVFSSTGSSCATNSVMSPLRFSSSILIHRSDAILVGTSSFVMNFSVRVSSSGARRKSPRVSLTSESRSAFVRSATRQICSSESEMQYSIAPRTSEWCGSSASPPEWGWCISSSIHVMAVRRFSRSLLRHWFTSIETSGPNSITVACRTSFRKSDKALSAACRISRLESLNMLNSPSRKSGR